MLFINTRPIDRAQALTQYLSHAGIDVINLPLLELIPRPLTADLTHLYSQLFDTQIIVVVSPSAVEIGMKYLHQSGKNIQQLKHIQWVAVGKKTSQELLKYGVSSHVPEVENSEGMLSLDVFRMTDGLHKVAFWRGEGGRQFMMQQCQERHIEVLNFMLYDRSCPEETQVQFADFVAQVRHDKPYWNCISSEASWYNWLDLTHSHETIINDCHYLVLGERLYQILQRDKNMMQKCFEITKISDLEPKTILQCIQQLQRTL